MSLSSFRSTLSDPSLPRLHLLCLRALSWGLYSSLLSFLPVERSSVNTVCNFLNAVAALQYNSMLSLTDKILIHNIFLLSYCITQIIILVCLQFSLTKQWQENYLRLDKNSTRTWAAAFWTRDDFADSKVKRVTVIQPGWNEDIDHCLEMPAWKKETFTFVNLFSRKKLDFTTEMMW